MEIAILNGNPTEENVGFDAYLNDLVCFLHDRGHSVKTLTLRELNIRHCTGCWGCWVKTPGLCIFEDDSYDVCRSVINSDLVVFASPIMMGYLSALMKKHMDKMIMLVHPYIRIVKGEAHHKRRYAARDYPVGGLLLERSPGADDEDIEIISAIHARTMINLRTELSFIRLMDDPAEEVGHAIASL